MAIILPKLTSSNKTQTLPEKPKGKDHSEQSVGSLKPGVHHPFIDKISIVVTPQEEDASDIFNNIWTQLGDASVFQDAAKSKWGPFKVAKWIALDTSDHRPLFHFAYYDKKALKARLEFNPRKLAPHGISELKSVLGSVFPDGWEYVLSHNKITRLDVAVDFQDTRPAMFSILPQQGLTTKEWAVDGKLETFVLGKKNANQTILYNKKHHRLAQGHSWSGKSLTRLERRLRNLAIGGLFGLSSLPNPFSSLALVEVPAYPPAAETKAWIWEMFRVCAVHKGLPNSLAMLQKERRTMYREYLKQHPHELWDPAAIWEKWPATVKQSELDQY